MTLSEASSRDIERLAQTLLDCLDGHTIQGGQAMTDHTPKLTDRDVLERARTRLQEHLPLHADGSAWSTNDLLQVLLGVAVNRATIEAITADLLHTPDPETLRRSLNAQLRGEDLPALLDHVNAALTDKLPERLWAQGRDVAIDLHDRPDYGTLEQDEGLWVRGEAKAGTTRLYRIATAYLMLAGMRVTLAVHIVRPEEPSVTVLEQLLERLDGLGLRPKRLVLDKGFAGTAVLRELTRRRQPAVIACPIRGKTGGTRALCRGQRSSRTRSEFTDADGGSVWAELAVCRVMTTARRSGRMERRASWLLLILVGLELTPQQARRLYRKRFGIESSYRCAGQVRGWTTSRNVAYRFVLLGLSFILVNVWLELRGSFTQVPRRGRRWLDTQRFALSRLIAFVRHALEEHYGVVHQIVALAMPRP
jgi:putative transposase